MPQDTEKPPPELELHWELPRGWAQTRSRAQASVTAQGPVALARRPRLTGTLEQVDDPLTGWWDGLTEVFPQALEDYRLLDAGEALVAGLGGVRRLLHYSRAGQPTLMEQWAAQDAGLRIVVLATLPPRSYDALADVLVAVVAGARVAPTAQGTPR